MQQARVIPGTRKVVAKRIVVTTHTHTHTYIKKIEHHYGGVSNSLRMSSSVNRTHTTPTKSKRNLDLKTLFSECQVQATLELINDDPAAITIPFVNELFKKLELCGRDDPRQNFIAFVSRYMPTLNFTSNGSWKELSMIQNIHSLVAGQVKGFATSDKSAYNEFVGIVNEVASIKVAHRDQPVNLKYYDITVRIPKHQRDDAHVAARQWCKEYVTKTANSVYQNRKAWYSTEIMYRFYRDNDQAYVMEAAMCNLMSISELERRVKMTAAMTALGMKNKTPKSTYYKEIVREIDMKHFESKKQAILDTADGEYKPHKSDFPGEYDGTVYWFKHRLWYSEDAIGDQNKSLEEAPAAPKRKRMAKYLSGDISDSITDDELKIPRRYLK